MICVYPVCTNGMDDWLALPKTVAASMGFITTSKYSKPRHAEYKDIRRLGRGYDPEKLDIDRVNKELPRFKKYRKRWQ